MSFHFQMINEPDSVVSGYTPMVAESPGIYQLNNFGMTLVAEAMSCADLFDGEMGEPDFDECWPPEGIDEERAEEILDALDFGEEPEPPLTVAEKEALERHEKAQEALLAVVSDCEDKVPPFKFGSNDGWIVSPAECRTIVAVLQQAFETDVESFLEGTAAREIGRDEARKTLEEWIAFNRVAAENGGYRVL